MTSDYTTIKRLLIQFNLNFKFLSSKGGSGNIKKD